MILKGGTGNRKKEAGANSIIVCLMGIPYPQFAIE
jgi:hypothetical protein